MATTYCSSVDGSDADDGSTWALAKATLAAAVTAAGNSGTVYVDNAHTESGAGSVTLTCPTTPATTVRILCVNRGADVSPPTQLATTATVTSTGGGVNINGFAYVYGITFVSGNGTTNSSINVVAASATGYVVLESCKFILSGTSSNHVQLGGLTTAITAAVRLINATCQFGIASQGVHLYCWTEWQDSPTPIDTNGTIPTTLLIRSLGAGVGRTVARFRNVDFSAIPSGKQIVNLGTLVQGLYLFENCKLGVGVVSSAVAANPAGSRATFVNCDSTDTNYAYRKYQSEGTILSETTVVRSGGASDGTTTVSRKVTSSANTALQFPLESDWVSFWNETTGSPVTVSVAALTDNVTLTDAECWVEVEYLGTSGFPLGSTVSDRAADVLATGVAQPTDATSVWTTTGITTPVQQTLSVTFTPQEKGIVRYRVCVAKASTTVYFDPKAVLS